MNIYPFTTFTGRRIDVTNLNSKDIDIIDIAHSLSLQCRFGGHCSHFYSVAQHCVRVSNLLPRDLALVGLLHDSTEAYLTDLPKPIKRLLPEYSVLEDKVWRVIAATYGLPMALPNKVKRADEVMLLAEADEITEIDLNWKKDQLKLTREDLFNIPVEKPKTPQEAKFDFLDLYQHLTMGVSG